MTTRTKAPAAQASPQIALGDRVTVPPLPGMPGLPGVWLVEQEQLCGSTRYLLIARKGAPGWHVVMEARCQRVDLWHQGKGKASA